MNEPLVASPPPQILGIADVFAGTIAMGLKQTKGLQTQDLEKLRELARKGNPFPLIAMQWPSLVVPEGHRAYEWFEGDANDPLNPCLSLEHWQRWFLRELVNPAVGELAFKGCTGAGKTAAMAIGANVLLDIKPSLRCSLTSDTWQHVKKNLYREVKKWYGRMTNPRRGSITETQIHLADGSYIQCLNPKPGGGGEAFSGSHVDDVDSESVYFFDEASSVDRVNYTNCLKNATKVVMAANPRNSLGFFREAYLPMQKGDSEQERLDAENTSGYCLGKKGKRLCLTVGGMNCTNVARGLLKKPVAPLLGIEIDGTKYEPGAEISPEHFALVQAVVPGQMDLAQFQEIVYTSDEEWEVECFAHGRFPRGDIERKMFLPSWFPTHQNGTPGSVSGFGLDVARSEKGDMCSLCSGGIDGVNEVKKYRTADTAAHARYIIQHAWESFGVDLTLGGHPVVVDCTGGYGSGVFDLLRDEGVWVIEFQAAARPKFRKGVYLNQRAECYGFLSERLDPMGAWKYIPYALPRSKEFMREFTVISKLRKDGSKVIYLEDKESIRRLLGRSPDAADSVALMFYGLVEKHDLLEKFNRRIIRHPSTRMDTDMGADMGAEAPEILTEFTSGGSETPTDEVEYDVFTGRLIPSMQKQPGEEVLNILRQSVPPTPEPEPEPSRTEKYARYFED